MAYLVVVAHPDDEVLGAGGTICKLTDRGEKVAVCILAASASARRYRPTDSELEEDTESCMRVLGVSRIFCGGFPNIQLNTVSHLELVQFIEQTIIETEADIIVTHHPADLNNDHLHTSLACQAAVRLFQRRDKIKTLKELLFMEVPSSTDWGLNRSVSPFNPNTFVEIGREGIRKKLEALSKYRDVMREYPHPRSLEAIESLAAFRGSQAGLCYAEAFESVFRRIETKYLGGGDEKDRICDMCSTRT